VTNVAGHAYEFVRRARNGEKPVARVGKEYAEAFLGALFREGFAFATECLQNISDHELRRIVEAILYSAAAGAVMGAAIGGAVGGPGGANVGAIVGAGLGALAACAAIVITVDQKQGHQGPELVVAVK
jgi:hypothetical protein